MQNTAGNDCEVKFYTGMPNSRDCLILSQILTLHKSLKIEDKFLAVLMCLRLGLLDENVAEIFDVSVATYFRIFAS